MAGVAVIVACLARARGGYLVWGRCGAWRVRHVVAAVVAFFVAESVGGGGVLGKHVVNVCGRKVG